MDAEDFNRQEGLVCFLRALLRVRAASRAPFLLRSLSGMKDLRQGAAYLGTWLGPLPPEAIVSVLDALVKASERKETGANLAVQIILSPALRLRWKEGLSRQVQAVARLEGRFDLAAMLLELPEIDGRFAPHSATVPKEIRDIPLGIRKAWARRTDIDLMERLLSDPDGAVIANLLSNPRLTIREVIRLASRPAVREQVLEMIAQHPRWATQYKVKIALAHNPSTPVRITLGILRLLMSQDLEELAEDSRLSRVVVRRALDMLAERRARSPSN